MHSIEDRCEGTLVIHAVGDAECTEPDCVDLEYARHFLVLDCDEITGGCQCIGEISIDESVLVRAS